MMLRCMVLHLTVSSNTMHYQLEGSDVDVEVEVDVDV